MANTKNLKPFPKGTSGNPGGRPRQTPLTDAYLEQLNQPYPKDPAGRTYAQVIAQHVATKAARGDVRAAQEMADRTEGRVSMAVPSTELTLSDRLRLTIEEWDRVRDGESLLGDEAAEFGKPE